MISSSHSPFSDKADQCLVRTVGLCSGKMRDFFHGCMVTENESVNESTVLTTNVK